MLFMQSHCSHCILAAWVVILCGSLVLLLLSITIERGYEMVTVFGDEEDPKQQRGLLVFDPKSIMYKNNDSSSCTICSDVPSR